MVAPGKHFRDVDLQNVGALKNAKQNPLTHTELAAYEGSYGVLNKSVLAYCISTGGLYVEDEIYKWNGSAWVNIVSDATTASNGLTKVGNDIRLGGALTATTFISGGNTRDVYFTGIPDFQITNAQSSFQHGTSGTLINRTGTGDITFTAAVGNVGLTASGGASTLSLSAANDLSISVSQDFVITSDTGQGARYAADYSGTFVAHSLVDKAYVDGLVTAIGTFAGNHDASGGLLPTVGTGIANAIDRGDYWIVTVAGTIAGLGEVAIGDVIFAKIANAAVAADFFAVEKNLVLATDTVAGIVILAQAADAANIAAALLNTTDVMTPNLTAQLIQNAVVAKKPHIENITLDGLTATTVTHNLTLANRGDFTIRCEQISATPLGSQYQDITSGVTIASVDADSLTIDSNIAVDIRVIVTPAS